MAHALLAQVQLLVEQLGLNLLDPDSIEEPLLELRQAQHLLVPADLPLAASSALGLEEVPEEDLHVVEVVLILVQASLCFPCQTDLRRARDPQQLADPLSLVARSEFFVFGFQCSELGRGRRSLLVGFFDQEFNKGKHDWVTKHEEVEDAHEECEGGSLFQVVGGQVGEVHKVLLERKRSVGIQIVLALLRVRQHRLAVKQLGQQAVVVAAQSWLFRRVLLIEVAHDSKVI